jgi:hypothetical protein
MPRLRAFVHVSTAYVNAHLPKGSHVEEALYPLRMRMRRAGGGAAATQEPLSHAEAARQLSALPHAKAERQARATLICHRPHIHPGPFCQLVVMVSGLPRSTNHVACMHACRLTCPVMLMCEEVAIDCCVGMAWRRAGAGAAAGDGHG